VALASLVAVARRRWYRPVSWLVSPEVDDGADPRRCEDEQDPGPSASCVADHTGHFGNCATRETPSGTVVAKAHPDSPRKIDGAVATIIAFDRACWHKGNTPATVVWTAV
jgi:hypothetical protein